MQKVKNLYKRKHIHDYDNVIEEETYLVMARLLKDVIPEKLTRPSNHSDDDGDKDHPAASWSSESDTEVPKKAGKADSSKRRASGPAEVETTSKKQKKTPKKQAAMQRMI